MNANTPQLDTSQSLLEPGPSARKLRTALLLAFGGLLILMLLAGVDALVRLHQLHAIEQQVSNRFLNHTRALSAVVVSVHLYHDQLTNYFLEDQSANPDEKDGEITNQAAQAHYALRSYPSDRGPQ